MPYDVTTDIGTATLVKSVKYIKANGVPGMYDETTTGLDAVVATETANIWTVNLDEHATDVPGFAQIFVTFSLASGDILHAFPITVDVGETTPGATDPDKPYYHSTTFIPAEAQAEKTSTMTLPVGVDENGKLWSYASPGMSDDAKTALLNCFAHVAWTGNDGQTYFDALEDALFPTATLESISVVYDQDRPVYDTDDLDVCRLDLTVTAHYSDLSSATVTAYTLSGTLTAGTSTITASYSGKTATFNVTVTHNIIPAQYQRVTYIGAERTADSPGAGQGTTGPHIATNITLSGTGTLKITIRGTPTKTMTNSGVVVGCGASSMSNAQGAAVAFNGNGISVWAYNGNYASVYPKGDGNSIVGDIFTYTAQFKTNEVSLQAGDGTPTVNTGTSREYVDKAIYLFCGYIGYCNYHASCKVQYIKIEENGTTLAELYPVYRKSDSVIGMYDVTNSTFYDNDGDGSFTKGANYT